MFSKSILYIRLLAGAILLFFFIRLIVNKNWDQTENILLSITLLMGLGINLYEFFILRNKKT